MAALCAAQICSADAGAATIGYEHGVDQQIVQVLIDQSATPQAYIVKKYLEPRKARTNPDLARTLTYELLGLESAPRTTLFKVPVEEMILLGSSASVPDGFFLVPVVMRTTSLDIVKATLGAHSVQRLDLTREDVTSRIDHVFALQTGYVEVRSIGQKVLVQVARYDGSAPVTVDTEGATGRVVALHDVVERQGNVFLLVTSVEPGAENILSLRLLQYDSQFSRSSRMETLLLRESAAFVNANFIDSVHLGIAVKATLAKSLREPPVVQLIQIGERPKVIRQFDIHAFDADGQIAFAGICNDQYVYARKGDDGAGQSGQLEYGILDSSGVEKRTWTEQASPGASILGVTLAPWRRELLSFVNFNQLEDARRKDGWYSWLGYRVDRIDIEKDCQ